MADKRWIEYYDFEKELEENTSIRVTGTDDDGRVRQYTMLSADVDKLPVNEYVGTGSSALCVDTSSLYMYEETSARWYLM